MPIPINTIYYVAELVFRSVRKIAHADWSQRGPEKAVMHAIPGLLKDIICFFK